MSRELSALILWVPFIPVAAALAIIDWRTRRLPKKLIVPCYIVGVPLVLLAGWLADSPEALKGALWGWGVYGGFFLLLWAVHPRGMGYGDVRLAGLLGIGLGYLGWAQLLLGMWFGFVFGGIAGVVLKRRTGESSHPFGPWMMIGALAGIAVGGPAWASMYG